MRDIGVVCWIAAALFGWTGVANPGLPILFVLSGFYLLLGGYLVLGKDRR